MENSYEHDDSLELGFKTWSRVIHAATKSGYREGVEEGSQAVLQADFDRGYADGFKTAFLLGKYKAFTAHQLKDIDHPKEITEILEKTRRGACHICDLESSNDSAFIDDDSEKVLSNHTKHTSKILEILYLYFKPLLEERGIDINNLNLN